ncbi:hypothetical protein [Phyllobacterium sp. YR531]|uniref:hypothetical protein n=1 Tax=Phyllobacterium sp. YR531 TaxID=1144343 RepID=UPI00026FA963|nr:hypothetical protein [Phyllobacterium sp. YR531]EJN05972.1 hypothetical protein PMI41_00564 [Phyllobacterium sp. YR531]
MADSDNSRTLPPVTRRDFHSVLAASLPTYPELAASIITSPDICDDDPAFVTWREWCAARQDVTESCLRQQKLEAKLISIVGSPPTSSKAWKAADEQVGYSKALKEESRASIAENRVAEILWYTPAQSIIGATAKLHAIVDKWQPCADSDAYPWPQIRVVIADLLKIDAQMSFRKNGRDPVSTSASQRTPRCG